MRTNVHHNFEEDLEMNWKEIAWKVTAISHLVIWFILGVAISPMIGVTVL